MARLVALALLLAIVVPATAAAEAATNDEYDEIDSDAMAGLRGAMPVVYPESTVGPVVGHAPPRPCPPLVPLPKTLQVLAPMVVPRSVAIKAASAELSLDAQTLAADLAAMNITVSATAPYTVTLSLNATAFGREAYSLACNSSHATLVGGADGVWWATRTLLQLFGGQPGSHSAMAATAASAAVSITKDEPEVGFRALLVDSARVPISKAFHLEVIKRLSDLKMNAYHLHLSDDTSYNLPSNIFPNLTGGTQRTGPVLSLRDWQEIVAYAKAYHVELVPEIDMPGHSAWILQRLPALRCPMATSDPRTYSRAYSCPLNFSPAGLNHTVEIVTQLLAEVMTIFNNSKYHHIGGDEVGENMLNSGFCSSLCKANGTYHPADCSTQTRWLDTTNGSSTLSAGRCSECLQMAKAGYHNFVQRIHRFIKSKGRTVRKRRLFAPPQSAWFKKNAIACQDRLGTNGETR
jgi:N-acetyl-beta-hexosaminidase